MTTTVGIPTVSVLRGTAARGRDAPGDERCGFRVLLNGRVLNAAEAMKLRRLSPSFAADWMQMAQFYLPTDEY